MYILQSVGKMVKGKHRNKEGENGMVLPRLVQITSGSFEGN